MRWTTACSAILLLSFSAVCAAHKVSATAQSDTAQTVTPMEKTPVYRVQVTGRTTRAVNYRNRGNTTIDFQGTKLDPNGSGKAKVESHSGRFVISAEFENLPKPSIYGPEYLTYVLWAITPEGRPTNLGEILPKKDEKTRITVTTDLQAFGLILTVEPYFAVTIPSDQVIMENVIKKGTKGWEEPIETKFDVLQRGEYTVDVSAAQLASETADEKMPIDLKEAINAVAIAKAAGAEKYAPDSLSKAEDFLARGEDYFHRHQGEKAIGTVARGAVQSAEDARLLTIRRKQEEAQEAQRRRAEEAKEQQQQAEQQREQAEQQRVLAEQQKQEAEASRAQAEQAKAEAEQARIRAQQEQAQALAERQAAQADAERARQAAQQAEREKEETRARLMQQLNQVLQTRESARGLIVSMPDVLFDFDKYTLRGEARERLAKVAGILLAYPGLTVQVEGHTDNIGSEEYNQRLSEQRAEMVRDFLVSQGVTSASITARGFGKTQPIASNDSAAGRQMNRRVELVVNGASIGNPGIEPMGNETSPNQGTGQPSQNLNGQPATPAPAVTPPPPNNTPPQH